MESAGVINVRKRAQDQNVLFSDLGLATSGRANMVAGRWGMDLRDDPQLME